MSFLPELTTAHDYSMSSNTQTILVILVIAAMAFWWSVKLQAFLAKKIAQSFLGFKLGGSVFISCLLGIIAGFISSAIISAFDGELLSLAVLLLATWPMLYKLAYKMDMNDQPLASIPSKLTHKEAAILSAASSFAMLAVFSLAALIIKLTIFASLLANF